MRRIGERGSERARQAGWDSAATPTRKTQRPQQLEAMRRAAGDSNAADHFSNGPMEVVRSRWRGSRCWFIYQDVPLAPPDASLVVFAVT